MALINEQKENQNKKEKNQKKVVDGPLAATLPPTTGPPWKWDGFCLGPGFHEEAAASGGGVDAGGSLVSVKRLVAVKLTMLKRNTKDYSNSVLTAV